MKRIVHFMLIIAAFVGGGVAAAKLVKKDSGEEDLYWRERADKFKTYYGVTTEWIQTLQSDCSIADYFENSGYNRVVIYGKGILGDLLLEEINKRKNIEVVCFADHQSDGTAQYDDIPVVNIEKLKDMQFDVIVVTPVFAYAEVKQALLEVTEEHKIVSLQDVVVECR